MDETKFMKYIGKKCFIVLKNNFRYTAVVPVPVNGTISIIDKFDNNVDITIDYISTIREAGYNDENNSDM